MSKRLLATARVDAAWQTAQESERACQGWRLRSRVDRRKRQAADLDIELFDEAPSCSSLTRHHTARYAVVTPAWLSIAKRGEQIRVLEYECVPGPKL